MLLNGLHIGVDASHSSEEWVQGALDGNSKEPCYDPPHTRRRVPRTHSPALQLTTMSDHDSPVTANLLASLHGGRAESTLGQ